MKHNQLTQDYTRGKQLITICAILLTMVGLVLDAITYHRIYSTAQILLQSTTFVLCSLAFILFSIDRNRHYVLSFLILSYTISLNIAFTTIYIHSFVSFATFEEANILSRDIYFLILYVIVSGFIIGRTHIFVQGGILFTIVIYAILILEEPFFLANASIYLISLVGFVFVLYFLVGTVNELIIGLKEANEEAHTLRHQESNKKQKLITFQNSILQLVKDEQFLKRDIHSLLERVCQMASENLGIQRASFWQLDDEHETLTRKHLVEDRASNREEVSLLRKDFPIYFSALEIHPFVAADNAKEHAHTREFISNYLELQSIGAMLDCPISIDGKTIGVICCENKFSTREWSVEEILFIQSLAVQISIWFKNKIITDLYAQLQLQHDEVREAQLQVKSMNDELNALNEELVTMNESLEETVKKRTSELETQNKQLTEYAFINSHILRAPLARILGLAQLIARETESVKDKQLLDALIISSNELDTIIRKISDLLYDGNNMTREDIQTLINKTIFNN